jgi:CRISPR-associated protein Cas1
MAKPLSVNLILNYGYGFLEGEVRRAINSIGLEPSAGFLHDFNDYQTKQSLVYDLQQPFRWLVDVSVIESFESGTLDLPDFYFTGEDYPCRFDVQAKQHFIDVLRERFNSGIAYKGRVLKWDTVIEQKASELGQILTGKRPTLDFIEPAPKLEKHDNRELRSKILALTPSQAKQLGIGKTTLYKPQLKSKKKSSFRLYEKVRCKIENVG